MSRFTIACFILMMAQYRMRILLVTPRLPYPPHRGDKLKIFNLIRQLSRRHEITLLSFVSSRKELRDVRFLQEYCARVFPILLRPTRSILNCISGLFSKTPFQVAYYASRRMHRAIEEALEGGDFDLMHVHLIRMMQYSPGANGRIPRVLDLTDAGSLYLKRFLQSEKQLFKRLFLSEELKRLTLYERKLEQFEMNLVCSQIDREVLLNHAPTARIELLYNGIDLDYFTSDGTIHPDPLRIVYTGNMKYYPNLDGVFYLVNEILPRIRDRVSGVKTYIVGKDPPASVRRLATSDIVITGFVPDIREYYLRSTVAVAPVRFGAGTLNKVLEPMALGVPVVASSIAVGGLPVKNGRELLIADSPEEFADAVVRLFLDSPLHECLAQNAMRLVRSSYGWETITAQLERYYESVSEKRDK